MANSNLRENVLLNLRSVTQSIKGGVPFERLQRDYKDLLGSPIPFKELGYNSLEAFIRDIPNVIALKKGSDGQLMAMGVADASTAHIVSLVSRQKTDTKKKPFRKPPPHYVMRKSISYRPTFRGGYRGSHSSHYSAPSYQASRSMPSKPAKPPSPPVQQHSKPRVTAIEQVPIASRKYEVAPRFLKLKEFKNGVLPQDSSTFSMPERTPLLSTPESTPLLPTPRSPSPAYSIREPVETIPPPRAVARSLPNKPQPIKPPQSIDSSRAALFDALESARTAKQFVAIHAKINKIEPVYRTVMLGQKAKSKGYVSTLQLGEKSYRSYPNDKPTEFEAEEEASKIAMKDIKERKGNFSQRDELPKKVSPDPTNFRQRVNVRRKHALLRDTYKYLDRDDLRRKISELPDNCTLMQRDDLRRKFSELPDNCDFNQREDLSRKFSEFPDNCNYKQRDGLPRKVSILADNSLKIIVKC